MTMKLKLNSFCVLCLALLALCEKATSSVDESSVAVDKLISALNFESIFQNHDEWMNRKDGLDFATKKKLLKLIPKIKESVMKRKIKGPSVSLDPDANRNLTQLITNEGYPVQKFVVQTKDGFLLDLHRIPYGRKNTTGGGPAIFLQHALLSTACDWVSNFANGSLAFILADHGYDVWLGNTRGNEYSNRHVSLTPDDERFWDWSFDEMAKYDLPAFIDFVLSKTGQPSVYYVGHSQGTMSAFALFSEQSEIQKKIRVFLALAPIISLNHMKSPLKYLSLFSDEEGYKIFGRKEFIPYLSLVREFLQKLCDERETQWMCYDMVFLMAGYDLTNLNKSRLAVYVSHTPSNTSTKDMIHFAQMYRAKRFAMYDFGSPAENQKHYGQDTSPVYNASKVTVPTLLFTASNDWLADPEDVKYLESVVPNIKARINFPGWNHLDFIWAMNAADVCYSKILEWLPKF